MNSQRRIIMYQSLQSGRSIAALLVLLFHLGGTISADKYFGIDAFAIPFSFGSSGVEFFFVLSGFIIYHVHKYDLGKKKSLYVYMYKRISRIYPAYLIVFISVWGAAMLFPQLRDSVPHDLFLIMKSLLLIPQNKEVIGGTGSLVLIVAWTLQYEIMFYIFFSAGIINKRIGFVLVGLFIFGSLSGLEDLGFPFSFIFSDYVWLFFMGMLSAKLISYHWVKKIEPRAFFFLGLLIYFITALDTVFGSEMLKSFQIILYGIGCSIIVIAMILFEINGKVLLKHNFHQLLGASSYALYLIHFPLISVLCKVAIMIGLKDFGVIGALLTYCIIFILCILVSIGFHLNIEKPIANKLRTFI
jgi:exopolysaccharide production protein ExoZ